MTNQIPEDLTEEERNALLQYLSSRFSVDVPPLVHADLMVWSYIRGGKSKTETCEWLLEESFRERQDEYMDATDRYAELVGLTPEQIKIQAYAKNLIRSTTKGKNPFDSWKKDKLTGLYIRT